MSLSSSADNFHSPTTFSLPSTLPSVFSFKNLTSSETHFIDQPETAMRSSPMAGSGWATMGFEVCQPNPGFDLIQNCDLPHPHKIFRGSDAAFASIKTGGESGERVKKSELLKALRLSQTRAREAERNADKMGKERDGVCNFLLAEAMKVLSYRQWVKLMEFQASKLQNQSEEEDDDGGEERRVRWVLLAICIGIGMAGVGLAFSCASF